jgi:hypothetical protein
MKRLLLPAVAALAGLAFAGTASAQNVYPYMRPNYGPYYRPGLSPYLNLLRGGDPASNYYLGTVPEFQRRQDARFFRAEIGNLDARLAASGAAPTPEEDRDLLRPLPSTGHPTAFNNTAGYFNNMNPGSMTPRPFYTPGPRPPATTPPVTRPRR